MFIFCICGPCIASPASTVHSPFPQHRLIRILQSASSFPVKVGHIPCKRIARDRRRRLITVDYRSYLQLLCLDIKEIQRSSR
ncbi:hypothetical protein EJB05_32074, partial [Eragrostis curvula]